MESMLKSDGTKIRILRIQRGWQQQDLARIACVRLRTVQRLEEGGNSSCKVLRSLARAFELHHEELLQPCTVSASRRDIRRRTYYRSRISEAVHAMIDGCYPFLPACRMMAVSTALVMVTALAIRLSPILVEEEQEVVSSGSSYLPPSLMSLAHQAMHQAEMAGSRPSHEGRPKVTQAAVISMPVRAESALPAPVPLATNVRPQPHPAHPQTSTAAGYMEWLTSLAESYPTTSISVGMHSQEAASLPKLQRAPLPDYVRFVPKRSEAADGDGAGVITRSLIKSGKSTAALFTKIGGSFKKAF